MSIKKQDFLMKLYLHPSSVQLLELRRDILQEFIEVLKPSNLRRKEYENGLKEVNWLLSKVRDVK